MVISVVEESQIGKAELAGWGGGPTFLGVSESASLKGAERREGDLYSQACVKTQERDCVRHVRGTSRRLVWRK